MINKQEIKERAQKIIDAGVEVVVIDHPIHATLEESYGIMFPVDDRPKKPDSLTLTICDNDEDTIRRIEYCENKLNEYLKRTKQEDESLASFLRDNLFFNKNVKLTGSKVLGNSKHCTILPQHRNVIMIDCEELVSTESDCIYYKNEMIGKLSR